MEAFKNHISGPTLPSPPAASGKWKRSLVLLFLFFISALVGAWAYERKTVSPQGIRPIPPELRGMALGLFHKEPHDYGPDLEELKDLGVNSVLLMVPWYQKNINADQISPRYLPGEELSTPEDPLLRRIIAQAHERGMQVLLMPFLRLEERKNKEWRGVIKPHNFATWTQSYETFLLHYAKLAQETGVEFLSVGSELGSMEKQDFFWESLIVKIRNSYSGKLLYSSNWDHYTHPGFWHLLDYIGITAYNRLSETPQPNLRELKRQLREIQGKLSRFMSQHPEKKLIITEVGYFSQEGTAKDPWNYFSQAPLNLQEQALCYQAFADVWNNTPFLEGVFWWVWFGDGGATDLGYTPRGKPAAQALKQWYKNSRENL